MDTNGLVLAAKVHGADLPDQDGGKRLVGEGSGLPRLELLWADGAYTGGFRDWLGRQLGWRLEVPYHRNRQLWRYELEEKPRGFFSCCLVVGLWSAPSLGLVSVATSEQGLRERLPETAEAMIYGAMSRIMLRRLVRTA